MMEKVYELKLLKKFTFLGKCSLSAIVFSLLTLSCNEEDNENIPENFTGEEQEIVFSMNVPGISESAPKFRSMSEAQENAIQTVDLLAFRKDNSNFDYHYKGVIVGNTGTSTQECKVKVRLAKYVQDMVIITNAETIVNTVVNSSKGQNISKEAFLAKLEYELSGGDQWKTSNNYAALPMWGETSGTIVRSTNRLSVSLLRMLAKIDVQLDEDKGVSNVFILKSVRLYNTSTKGRIVPNSAVVQSDDNSVSVTAPSLPDEPDKYKHLGPLVYQDFSSPGINNIAMKGAIYTFETQAPQDEDPLEATCLVVGGRYGGDASDSYYRVDFLEDGNFQDILRNHRYLVNIVSVTGPGYKNPDEAFRNKAINMNTDILVWNENNMYDVVFDGQWYLSVSRDIVHISREKQDTAELFVITDYNPNPIQSQTNGWHVESITDITSTPTPCTWLIVNPMSGAPNELKNVKITTISENNTGATRSARIVFAAGRLRYPVTVLQSIREKPSITIIFDNQSIGTNPVEVIFPIELGIKNPPEKFRVTWTPQDADLIAYKTTVSGIQYSEFGFTPELTVFSGERGDIGIPSSVAPTKTVQQGDVAGLSHYERGVKVIFTVSNGINTFERSVIFKHVYNSN
jgi:hypothetical protein